MPSLTSHSSRPPVSVPLIEKFMLPQILSITLLGVAPSLVTAQQLQSYKSPDGILRVLITPVSKSCPEDRLVIRKRDGALIYRKHFSSCDCEHGDNIVRGEWSPDSQFFVFNVESTGGHQPGHRPVFFYSRSENKLYGLENYIGYIVAQDFTLEAPHIIKTGKQKIIGELDGVPVEVNLRQILRRKGRDGQPKTHSTGRLDSISLMVIHCVVA